MSVVAGFDPGSSQWSLVVMDGEEEVIVEESWPTTTVKSSPQSLLSTLNKFQASLIAAPSGYGLPFKKLEDLTDKDWFELTLRKKEGGKEVMGLERFLRFMNAAGMPAVILPSIKHLPTVPVTRKKGRIDLGTPDKLCAVAYAMNWLRKNQGIPYEQQSFIHAELGSQFNAFMAIEGGKIINGIGGSMSSSARLIDGIDAEVAFLRGEISKEEVYQGGWREVEKETENEVSYWSGVGEDLQKISESFDKEAPPHITFSGKVIEEKQGMGAVKKIREKLSSKEQIEIRFLAKTGKASTPAHGAALIANGLAGGSFEDLVERLEIRQATGSVLDFVQLD